jgi:ABC-type arginine transport system permease subunit
VPGVQFSSWEQVMDLLHGWSLEIAKGALVTISVALLSLVVGMIWGILGALALLSRSKALARIGNAYTRDQRKICA